MSHKSIKSILIWSFKMLPILHRKIYDPSNNRFAIFPDLFLFQVLQQSFATNFYVLCAKNHNGINAATNLFINFFPLSNGST